MILLYKIGGGDLIAIGLVLMLFYGSAVVSSGHFKLHKKPHTSGGSKYTKKRKK